MQTLVIDSLLTAVGIVLIGFAAKQVRLIGTQGGAYLSQIVMNITLPLLLLSSFTFTLNWEIAQQSAVIFVVAVAALSSVIIISRIFGKLAGDRPDHLPALRFLLIFGNTTFVGFPLCFLFYGEEGLFLATIYNLVHMGFMWTYGINLFTKAKSSMDSFRHLVKEPAIWAILISIIFVMASIELPGPVFKIFNMVGSTTIPLSFLLVGVMLNFAVIKGSQLPVMLITVVLRMILIPLLLLLVLKFFQVSNLVTGVSVIMLGTPSAVLASAFAEKFGGNHELAAAGVLITTMAAALSLPLLIALMGV
ncbi:MAG: AEC family transporter [Bacillota bacterium]